ncbi:MAG: PucC family protein, partial [Pseudomonadota bacterium]
LTALLALGTLVGFGLASHRLGRGGNPHSLIALGAAIGIPGFIAVILSSSLVGPSLFVGGVLATGLGAGLFGHATLTATIRNAPPEQVGLSLGAWGAVQATCAGIGVALAGIVRDVLASSSAFAGNSIVAPYNVVFSIEIAFLAAALAVILPLVARRASLSGEITVTTQRPKSLEVS